LTICREWSLVKRQPEERRIRMLRCRSWGCEECAPDRKKQLIGLALGGKPTRFMTLTSNPNEGGTPEERCGTLHRAANLVWKRIRRRYPTAEFEFINVTEATKAGEPHLHFLIRGPHIDQRFISKSMKELINAPIVDIRRIKNAKQAAAYVAKYIGKAPHKFGSYKRYWTSRNYDLRENNEASDGDEPTYRWEIDRRSMYHILEEWVHEGWAGRKDEHDTVKAVYVGFRDWNPPGGGP